MKRITSILLLVVLVLSMFTGCNQNELSMYEISNEISLLDAAEQSGYIEFDFDIASLFDPYSDTYEQDMAMLDLVQQQIDTLHLDKLYYTASMDQDKNVMQVEYYIKDDANKNVSLFEIRLVDNAFYVNYDGLSELILPYLKANDNTDPKLLAAFEKTAGFIQFDIEEIYENAYSPYSATSLQMQNQFNLKERKAFLEEMKTLIDDFMVNTLSDFTTDKVTKSYNSTNKADMYSYTFTSDDIVVVGLNFAEYFLNHFGEFKTFILALYSNDSFLEYSGIAEPEDKEFFIQNMTDTFDAMEAELESVKVSFAEFKANEEETGEAKAMLKSALGDSSFTYGLGQEDSNTYHQNINLYLNFTSPMSASENFTLTCDAHAEITKRSSVRVSAPAEFMTFETFNGLFPDTLSINVDYDDYTYQMGLTGSDYGYIDTLIRDGRSYVAIEDVPGKLGYAIKWSDPDQKPYYILPDGSDTAFVQDFFVENGIVYIAVSEYRNVGYTVTWDDYSRTITIETN